MLQPALVTKNTWNTFKFIQISLQFLTFKNIIVLTQIVEIEEFLKTQQSGIFVIDVRTPAEFEHGHIPGAKNLPLFSNEERALVGTTYKQISRNEAILQGLKFVGPRLHELAQEGLGYSHTKKVLVHCWRGGLRSASMSWLLNIMGVETCTLSKGYKAFRNYVLQTFERPYKFIVLGGKTGSAKTHILWELRKQGEQVIDLEQLADHRGSAFGRIGQKEDITQEQFENSLAMELQSFDLKRPIWVEDESRHVGRIVIPLSIWDLMRISQVIYLNIPQIARVEFLMSQYGATNEIAFLKKAFFDIKKKLGNVRFLEAITALEANDLPLACKIALDYYDKAYEYGLEKRDPNTVHKIQAESINMQFIVKQLLEQVRSNENIIEDIREEI